MAYLKEQFTAEQKEAILKQGIAFWNDSSEVMKPFYKRVSDYERLYRVLLPKTLQDNYEKQKDKSYLVPPDIYNNVSSLRSHIALNLFGSSPYAQLAIDGSPNKRNETTVKGEQVLQSMLDMAKFERESDKAIHQLLCAGRTATFTQWHKQWERVPKRDEFYQIQFDEQNHPIFENQVVAEYAETISLDIRRVRIDSKCNRVENMRMCGYEKLENVSDLMIKNRDLENFYNFDEKKVFKTSFDHAKYYEHVDAEITDLPGLGENKDDYSDNVVSIQDIRGLFKVKYGKKTVFEDLILVIGNLTEILAVKRNDLPLAGWELFDFPALEEQHGRFFSMGIIEPAMDLFIEKFVKKNQSLDEANRSTYTRYIADKAGTADWPDVLEHIPDQILKVDVMASGLKSVQDIVQPLLRQPGTQETFRHAAVLTDEVQQTMKLNDFVQGLDPSRKETATAVDALQRGGEATLRKLLMTIKDTYLAPAWRKQLILYSFFRGHEENVIHNQQGNQIVINRGELNHFFKVDIDIASTMTKPGMIRRFVEMFAILQSSAFVDQYELFKTAFELLQIPNPDKLLPPNQHLQIIIDRENIALGYSVEQPVSPFDPHESHIRSHAEYIDFLKQKGGDTKVIMAHLEQHQKEVEKQVKNIANTRKETGVRETANNNQPDGGGVKISAKGAA